MLIVPKPISDAFCRLNSKVAWDKSLAKGESKILNQPHLEKFHVVLDGNFKAIEWGVQVVWDGHWVKHPYSWRASDLDNILIEIIIEQISEIWFHISHLVPDIYHRIALHSW